MKKRLFGLFLYLLLIFGMQWHFVRADNYYGTPDDYLQYAVSEVVVTGNVYYVAKNGSNSWDGSLEHPWLTIQKAADTMVAGDTVYIKEGVYTERAITEQSGLPDKFIT